MKDIVIMGIDPGTNEVGVCIFNICIDTYKIKKVKTYSIPIKNTTYYLPYEEPLFDRLLSLREDIHELIYFHDVHYVSMENGFSDIRFPGAYGPIMQSIAAIHLTIKRFGNSISLTKVEPSLAKKAVGAKGNANKEDMKKAVWKLGVVNKELFGKMTEHEIDAIAIAMYCLNWNKKNNWKF